MRNTLFLITKWMTFIIALLPDCVCAQSCLTLCDPMNCSRPGSSVQGIFQARILEWVAISFSRGSSQLRDWTHVSCVSYVGRQILYHWATTEDCKKIFLNLFSHFQLRTSQSWLCYLVCWVNQRLVMELLQSPCFHLPSCLWYMLSKNQLPPITPASLLILFKLSFLWVGEVSSDASHVLVPSKVAHFKRNGFCQKSKLKLFNKTRSPWFLTRNWWLSYQGALSAHTAMPSPLPSRSWG